MKRYFVIIFTVVLIGCHGTRPDDIGVNNGQLKPCPESPNCISTQADPADEQHYMAALQYDGQVAENMSRLKEIINSLPRTEIIIETDNYLHAEFTSKVFRFIDDVEFYFDESNTLIHFRSASRLGHSDLGVNRERMEEIADLFAN